MNLLEALLLGIIQGITEFLPVSSSAHLKIFKKIFSIPETTGSLFFDLSCHAGTVLALSFFFRKKIWTILQSFKQITLFSLALFPLIPVYFLLKPLREALSNPEYLGCFLFITAFILFACAKFQDYYPVVNEEKKYKHVLWIGIAQTMALIPGISRSGSTIAMARFCGWKLSTAAEFSFLLAIPAVLGGEFLELLKLTKQSQAINLQIPTLCLCVGFFSSFLVGLFTCRAIFWIYNKEIIRPFAWYCLVAGCVAMAIFNG